MEEESEKGRGGEFQQRAQVREGVTAGRSARGGHAGSQEV